MPVLVDENGTIIAGHARVLAAQQLGLKDVPVMTAQGWSEDQKRAYVIADNRLPELSGWDEGLLGEELLSLNDSGFDIGLTGFDLERFAPSIDPNADKPEQVNTGTVEEQFWINVSGPLPLQADVLEAVKNIPGVEIKIGTVNRDG